MLKKSNLRILFSGFQGLVLGGFCRVWQKIDNTAKTMNSPIEMSDGQSTVKIYTGSIRERAYYQISFYRAGRRERRTFSDKQEAKREAKAILGQLASQAADVEEAIPATDVESLVAARAALKGIDLPLHLAVEGVAEAVRKLGASADPVVAVHEA